MPLTEVASVGAIEARALQERGYTYVDVRSPPEFAEGRPAGAINVPCQIVGATGLVPNPDFVATARERLSLDTPIVIGCKSGARSRSAAALLAGAGFTTIVIQRAGFDGTRDHFGRVVEPGWSRVELPVERG